MRIKHKAYLCRECNEADPAKFYGYNKSRCKVCVVERNAFWRAAHPEYKVRQNEYYRRWYANGGRKPLTEWLCPKCGETDPSKFYSNRQICQPCQASQSRERYNGKHGKIGCWKLFCARLKNLWQNFGFSFTPALDK